MVAVSGKGCGRVSIAGLVCLKPGRRGRLMWRTRLHRGRAGERGSFSEEDYIAFLDQPHQRLNAPIVLVWDNLNTHVSRRMRADRGPGLADCDPATVLRPGPQPHRGRLVLDETRPHQHRRPRHRPPRPPGQTPATRVQQQTDPLARFLAQTGMTLDPEPP